MATETQRQAIVDALMTLAGERAWGEISLADVAARAGVPLSVVRSAYAGRTAIVADFVAGIDAALLDEAERGRDAAGDSIADEPARDRLLDVILRRLDLLAPHKPAIRGLAEAAKCDPGLALCLARIGCRAQPWTLAAAGIEASSPLGRLRAGGLSLVMARVLPVWLDDDDPGLGRTMATLDRSLTRGADLLDRAEAIGCKVMRFARRMRERGREARRERAAPGDGDPAATAADAGAT